MQDFNNKLEYLLEQDVTHFTVREFIELVDVIQKSELLLSVEIEIHECGGSVEPTIVCGPNGELVTPIFTNESHLKGRDIEVWPLDGLHLFEILEDYDVEFVLINPFTNNANFKVSTFSNKDFSKKMKVIDNIRSLLHNHSTTLTKDVDLYYRTPFPMDEIENVFPINAGSDISFKEKYEYLNILKLSVGDKIMPAEHVFKNAIPFHVIIAPETEFELIDKKDDGTLIWKCVSQPFYD